MSSSNEKNAKPFLKWAGGKKQVIKCIDKKLPHEIQDSNVIVKYAEPFLGGGAVFFHLISKFEIKEAYLGDINRELILTYDVIQGNKYKKLISKLKSYSNAFLKMNQDERRIYFNDIRSDFNNNLEEFDYKNYSYDHIIRAAQMIFLNRTCFNGLYRVNKSGKFNVPIGKYKNPSICDEGNIENVHDALKGVTIVSKDYMASKDFIDGNTFVYLDPPYLPIKKTSFTSYSAEGFGINEQKELSQFCKWIDNRGAKFILSNSDPKNHDPDNNFFKDTYGKLGLKICNHKKIEVRRSINSKGNKRGPINELLIYNY
ncbi:Dam family site-specific DNA-(adenine-N6)-methyltransferase [uncultured Methanobrevibacter sp.]|uniref:DNA adenine methylase n=1 Tax=uncultured Methanobrevibacter sp. TaxID=253161 RepID=UPI0025CE1290|nr:Dam family site-specific DNA-(adenine-N6)-methyltransferase [uncultured Methanobrevibacter sp.]